ncbi:4Fe-4S binding protein [Methanothermobacter sp. K4]|uniref:4Fe-4S binding protein n=1 Tax=Methanothermobacter sp. K4 TaxID=2913262 RepID=UPI001EDBA8C7|nr:4Fe-4S binding protein [Methanothermobacter sp. K4]MCG2829129.1 4Fe-4S binding protein [Methanothermobacter sp. K4]
MKKRDSGCCEDTAAVNGEKYECSCNCGFLEYPDECRVPEPENPSENADDEFIARLEEYARSLGIRNIGYTRLTPDVILAGDPPYMNAVVLTVEMDDDAVLTPPGREARETNDRLYEKLADLTFRVADYLRINGYGAVAIHPMSGLIDLPLLGQNAGIGFKGRNGLLISPGSGPAQKISAVLTGISNLPYGSSDHEWIPSYCGRCGRCIRACPRDALVEVETCCGSTVLLLDDRCTGCSDGCTQCIESCPFYRKNYENIRSAFEKVAKPESKS